MKLVAALALLMSFSVPALARSLNDNGTPYQTLSEWYKSAKPVQYKEVADTAFAGKCFKTLDQETAVDHVLIVTHKNVGGDRGPAFPATEERKAILIESGSTNIDGSIKARAARELWADTSLMINSDSDPLKYNQKNVAGEVLRYDSYLVTLISMNRDLLCEVEIPRFCKAGETIKKGTPIMACYYYQEIK